MSSSEYDSVHDFALDTDKTQYLDSDLYFDCTLLHARDPDRDLDHEIADGPDHEPEAVRDTPSDADPDQTAS
jgi:hypothetical protein